MINGIKKRCIDVMIEILGVEPSDITDETSPDNLPEWDSLSHVRMILELEKVFNIPISPEEGIELESFKMICDYIEKKLEQ